MPMRATFPACWPSAASRARTRPRARITASPIRSMRTSVGMAGGRIAEYDESQERVEVMRNAGSRARADPTLPAVLCVGLLVDDLGALHYANPFSTAQRRSAEVTDFGTPLAT